MTLDGRWDGSKYGSSGWLGGHVAHPGEPSWAKVLPLSLKSQDVGARRPIVERGWGQNGAWEGKISTL